MLTNIPFSELDGLIQNWIFETDKEVTTFKKLENYIKLNDLKISVNEENITELWNKYIVIKLLETKLNYFMSTVINNIKYITNFVEYLENVTIKCAEIPNDIRNVFYNKVIFFFNYINDIVEDLAEIENGKIDDENVPAVQLKYILLKNIENLDKIAFKINKVEDEITKINSYLSCFQQR